MTRPTNVHMMLLKEFTDEYDLSYYALYGRVRYADHEIVEVGGVKLWVERREPRHGRKDIIWVGLIVGDVNELTSAHKDAIQMVRSVVNKRCIWCRTKYARNNSDFCCALHEKQHTDYAKHLENAPEDNGARPKGMGSKRLTGVNGRTMTTDVNNV